MRWFTLLPLALLVCLGASNASAGRIFGDIKMDGKPLPAGITLTLSVVPPVRNPGAHLEPTPIVADTTVTDEFGSYKLTVKEEGKCILSLVYEKQTAGLAVFSYRDATRYDLILETRDGTLTLRRK